MEKRIEAVEKKVEHISEKQDKMSEQVGEIHGLLLGPKLGREMGKVGGIAGEMAYMKEQLEEFRELKTSMSAYWKSFTIACAFAGFVVGIIVTYLLKK